MPQSVLPDALHTLNNCLSSSIQRGEDHFWKGERVLLSVRRKRLANPADFPRPSVPKNLSKVYAIQDFRAQIHAYQQEHGVSGLIWHDCHFRGRSIRIPELHPQLAAHSPG